MGERLIDLLIGANIALLGFFDPASQAFRIDICASGVQVSFPKLNALGMIHRDVESFE
jgi:hypothetical protein